jgi:hypothetical protein
MLRGRAGYLLWFLYFDAWRGVFGGLAVCGCFDTCRNGRLFIDLEGLRKSN